MNLNLLLAVFSPILFSVSWPISNEPHQDFFILNGENSSAHFLRKNETFYLHLEREYQTKIISYNDTIDSLTFSWPELMINGINISEQDLNYYTSISVNSLTFLNPEFVNHCPESSMIQATYLNSSINYGFIALFFIASLILDKIFGNGFTNKIVTLFKRVQHLEDGEVPGHVVSTINEEDL